MIKKKIFLIFSFLLSSSCQGNQGIIKNEFKNSPPKKISYLNKEKAYFASGCFWCVEAIYESVYGVEEVFSGYAGGNTNNPTYNSIGTGQTGHAESVEVIYDPLKVSFKTLVNVFFGSHDPTSINRQGPDVGSQYRSIAFFTNKEEQEIINKKIDSLTKNKTYQKPIATEVRKIKKFYYAEDYHQDYEKLNPNNPYVRNISVPRLNKFKSKFKNILKETH
ncbi:MAG: peptide-methionine (S)-S-oxide reductase [Flavobacteriaceae bacterium]|nr:peptide-methionine (S)-S-oxide reductase [Flavobacteriaceae bacterium]|tara:strand:+ start:1438 stop:2097 length:660 start_codon:yes stop_codon:yes gene_type:complete